MARTKHGNRSRKGQAALEYIVTYGWAFLVLLVAVGALAYFGVINPGKWLPTKCDLGAQLECVDYQILAAGSDGGAGVVGPRIDLYLRNNFGKDISITNAQVQTTGGVLVGKLQGTDCGGVIAVGKTCQVNITESTPPGDITFASLLKKGEKQQYVLKITFNKYPVATSSHTLTGSLYAEAK